MTAMSAVMRATAAACGGRVAGIPSRRVRRAAATHGMLHARAGIALHSSIGSLRGFLRLAVAACLGGRSSRDPRGFDCIGVTSASICSASSKPGLSNSPIAPISIPSGAASIKSSDSASSGSAISAPFSSAPALLPLRRRSQHPHRHSLRRRVPLLPSCATCSAAFASSAVNSST